jgi:pilus assembly protein CpaB
MITIVSLGASAVLGLGALFVAKAVLPNVAAAKPGAAGPASAMAPIVIATKEIKFGDKLDASMMTVAHVPADVVPQGAFQTPAQVLMQDHGGAPVALTSIAVHEALLPAKLSGPGARASVAAEIKEGMRAYTVRVNDVGGVGGHALPGDRVDVVLMRDLTPNAQTRTYVSDVVLQNVRVLGIDLNADLNANKPAEPKNTTLEVSVEDAQKLSIAATLGTLSLALRRTGEADATPTKMMGTRDFVAGGAAAAAPQVRAVVRRPRAGGGGGGSLVISVVEYTGGARRPLPAVTDAPAQPAPAASDKPAA